MRTRSVPLLLVAALLLVPTGAAADGPDAVVELRAGSRPADVDGGLVLALRDVEPNASYSWDLRLAAEYAVVEFRIHPGAFDVARAQQVVPLLRLDANESACQDAKTRGACEYPLFTRVSRVAVWEVDAPARISNLSYEGDVAVLRLGIPGPVNATLALERDVVAPRLDAGPRVNLTWRDFYQQTTTDELALVDLQVRKAGAEEWVQSPTPEYHLLQKFPIQGLDAATTYEQRFVVTDWAGNVNTTDIETFTTPAEPERPRPVVRPLSPAPNATLLPGEMVVVRAAIESPDSPIAADGVRVFYDLKEVREGFEVRDGVVVFLPPEADRGLHTVSIEVTNEAGGQSQTRWAFRVGPPEEARESPAFGVLGLVGAAAAVALLRRLR